MIDAVAGVFILLPRPRPFTSISMNTQNEVDAEVKPTTFFSASAGLIVNINVGRRIIEEGGTTKMVDQKIAEFTPIGDGFGRLTTSDPEIIEKLTQRMGTVGDVFDGAEYTRRTTPAEVRLKMQENDYQRLLADHNRLLNDIREGTVKGVLPSK